MNSQIMELPVEDAANKPSNENVVNMLAQVSEQPSATQCPINRLSRQINSEEERSPVNYDILPFSQAETATTDTAQRLALLYELPRQFETETRLDELLQIMLNHLVDVIPAATHGALLLRDSESDELLLKAYVSSNGLVVNKPFVRRAMSEGKGFIWQCREENDVHDHMSGIYVSLLWQGEALGVICVNNPQRDTVFTEEDLQLISTVAHCVAMAIANRQLQEDIRQKKKLLD